MSRKKILGLVLGLSGFLLFYSSLFMLMPGFPLVLLMANNGSGISTIVWILIALFLSIFFLLFLVIMSIRLGFSISRHKTFPKLNWLQTILTSIISILLAIFIPYLITIVELRWKSKIVPNYPNAYGLKIHTGPILKDVIHSFNTEDSESDIMMYFTDEFKKKDIHGWWSKKDHVANFNYSQGRIMIKFIEKKKENKVEVTYNPFYFGSPNAQWFILFITITAFIYANIKIKRNDENYNEDE
jgi:heme/copper-type cytochrome/quinol oxidase subunit 2